MFGKRTSVQSSRDKYANQETAFLLQRVEQFPGLVILASNIKSNIDTAFLRRFSSVINFPVPDFDNRYLLWEKSLPSNVVKHDAINLSRLAHDHKVFGAVIMNAMHYACLKALERKDNTLQYEDIKEGLELERQKEMA